MPERYSVAVTTRAPQDETNAYVLGDAEQVLVDPAGRTLELDTAAAETIEHVAVTHTHPDHVGAVEEYAERADATLWTHAAFAERFERATGVASDRGFRPGDEIGDSGVEVMDTPGHAPDHVAFLTDDTAATGDLVFSSGSVFVGADDGDMCAYLASLRRLAARDLDRLYPGHGPVVENPRERLHELYAHRVERERRVLAAVGSGAETVDEILDAAYDKDLTGVRDLAGQTVRAHLDKLTVEDRVAWDGARARPA